MKTLLLILISAHFCHAAFEIEPGAVRAAAMGGAYTAVADDSGAMLYNPAGLWQVKKAEVAFQHGTLQQGFQDGLSLGQSYLGWVQESPSLGGGFGLSYGSLSLSSLYQERQLSLAYAKVLAGGFLSLGAAWKHLQLTYGEDAYSRQALDNNGAASGGADPLLSGGRKKSASAFDLGVLSRPLPRLSLGLSVSNLNRPDMGLEQESRIPSTTRLGAAWRLAASVLALDFSTSRSLQGVQDRMISIGAEHRPLGPAHFLALRGGMAAGTRNVSRLTMGFGIEMNSLGFDYAFAMPLAGLEASHQTHRVALRWKFDWPYRLKFNLSRP